MNEMVDYTKEIIEEIKEGDGKFRHDNLTNTKCPECGKRMLSVNGKNSKMLVCQDRECGYRETIERTSNARCPVCHKKMSLKGKGKVRYLPALVDIKKNYPPLQKDVKKKVQELLKKTLLSI